MGNLLAEWVKEKTPQAFPGVNDVCTSFAYRDGDPSPGKPFPFDVSSTRAIAYKIFLLLIFFCQVTFQRCLVT
jgi:hypothetical protein